MNQPSNDELVVRPLVCFALVVVVGVFGFGYAKLTNNGFFLIGFLIPYVLCSLIGCVLGAVFAAKAYRKLPANHKGRHILTAVIARVTYTAGYVLPGTTPEPGQTPLPADLENAVIEQAAFWFQNRDKLGLIRNWPSGGTYQVFSQLDLLPNVAAVLRRYARLNP